MSTQRKPEFIEEDLSADEESWINERVLSGVTSRLGG